MSFIGAMEIGMELEAEISKSIYGQGQGKKSKLRDLSKDALQSTSLVKKLSPTYTRPHFLEESPVLDFGGQLF